MCIDWAAPLITFVLIDGRAIIFYTSHSDGFIEMFIMRRQEIQQLAITIVNSHVTTEWCITAIDVVSGKYTRGASNIPKY